MKLQITERVFVKSRRCNSTLDFTARLRVGLNKENYKTTGRREIDVQHELTYDTIRYDIVYFTCAQKLTGGPA